MIKESFLEMAKRHQVGDILAQGEWETCSVGCFNLDYGNDPCDFAALARKSGYEEWTHHVQEAVFEGLPEDDAINWHVQFAEKMLTVKDFDSFYHSFMVGVLEVALPHDNYNVVQPVIDLHKDYENATPDDWNDASKAAYAASSAARANKDASAASAAKTAAYAAQDSARMWPWAPWTTSAVASASPGTPTRTVAWHKIKDAFLNADG